MSKKHLLLKRLVFGGGLLSAVIGLQAAIPLGVVQTFDAIPAVTDWSTLSVGTSAGTYTDAAALDAAVIANTDATAITNVLGSSATTPPSQNAVARWNSTGLYLQTRATGNEYILLMARVQNTSGGEVAVVDITYDWDQKNPIPVNESVAGHRVFYSTTGARGSWALLPTLSTFDNNSTAASLKTTIVFPSPWAADSLLYLIWADDNGPGSTTDPQEGAYTIDNFLVAPAVITPIEITQDPAAQTTIEEGAAFALSVVAAGSHISYQWHKEGVGAIAGATQATYAVPSAAMGDAGGYFCVLQNPLGTVNSGTAQVTVEAHTSVPRLVQARGSSNLKQAIVSFSERILTNEVSQDQWNYSIAGEGTPPGVAAAAVDATGTNVILTLDGPLTPGGVYAVTVNDISDLFGFTLDPKPSTAPLLAWVISRGFALEELFLNIGTGTLVGDLTSNPKYPDSPDRVRHVPLLEGPLNAYDNFGTRLVGWLAPATSGDHTFYMASFAHGELRLSPSEDPASVALIAQEVNVGSNYRLWRGDPTAATRGIPPCNISTNPIALAAGQRYAFEALAKAAGGNDFLGVTWRAPGDPAPVGGTPGIPGAFLYSLADPVGASVTITQQPASFVANFPTLATPQTNFVRDFGADDGGFSVFNYGTPPSPWVHDAARGTWSCHGTNECVSPLFSSGLRTPVLSPAAEGQMVLTFRHRHSFEGFYGDATPTDGVPWDGGQLRLSVNGEPFRTVPLANLSGHTYGSFILGSLNGSLTATPGWENVAFVGSSPGYTAGEYVTTTVVLGSFLYDESVQIEFVVNWDDCAEGTEPNWEIDSVQIVSGITDATMARFTVGASSTYLGAPNTNLVYVWQRDNGSGFQDIPGAYAATYSFAATPADSGAQLRCVVCGPGASATSAVVNVVASMPLNIRYEEGSVRLFWPAPATGFLLEYASELPAPFWTPVPDTQYNDDGTWVYYVEPANVSHRYYRLRHQ